MDKIKEKVSDWLSYFKDYINYFQIVDQQKKVIYFRKYTLDANELFEIHNFVLTLKLNLFSALIEQFKYCANNLVIFENKDLTEREKVMAVFSSCFLNYYKKFLYDIDHTFEEFFDENFMSLIKTVFKFDIKNLRLFQTFCFCFFDKMKEEIKNLNYEQKIKPLKHTYNPKLDNQNTLKVLNRLFGENNNSINLSELNSNINSINEEAGIKQRAVTYLIAAKERMVDLVFEMRYRGIFPKICVNEINKMNIRLHELGNMAADHEFNNLKFNCKQFQNNQNVNNSFFQKDNNSSFYNDNTSTNFNDSMNQSNLNISESKNRINLNLNDSINQINKNNNKECMDNMQNSSINDNNKSQINIIKENENLEKNNINFINPKNINNINGNSAFNPMQNINNTAENKNNNIYSQRLTSEIFKDKIDDETLEIIKSVAKKVDEQFLPALLNISQKPITIIKYFSCYIIEITPEMLQNIEPNHKEILKNFAIKYIILAKELYNTTMELFCSIYGLSYNNVDRFVDLASVCGIQLKYAEGLYKLFRDYAIILLEKGCFNNLRKTVEKFVELEKINWDKVLTQFSDKFPV